MSAQSLPKKRLTLNNPPHPSQPSSSSTSRSITPVAYMPQPKKKLAAHEPIFIDSDDDEDDLEEVHAGGSGWNGNVEIAGRADEDDGVLDAREAVKVALAKLDAEINSVKSQLEPLQILYTSLLSERSQLESQLCQRPIASQTQTYKSTSKNNDHSQTNYHNPTFPWPPAILSTLKSTFHLPSFRLCQEGVINAALDDRDIVCVMPTGGGKSLTYQLPAVMGAKGLTVVISPLLALIWDQVRALREIGVECVMLTGGTGKEEQNEIYKRMEEGGKRGNEIRLCYVTPEKISKSKRFMSVLEKVNSSGRLSRFVIDEAHCCSQLGHDFRPDYKKLSVLKTLFPRVPIQAVTATLSRKTMPDLLKILRLPPICDGTAANASGTVFFSAPLYRPNLRYRVLSKPSSAKMAIAAMGQWILDNHANESGIIYCLSKKDAETVADELKTWSSGDIKTGVYHAGVDDAGKERIHLDWRKGRVNVICATIAFGLGIDKGDVRYVIHHSMSKSLEGYYQETGRAGRDGNVSDCVLFYRGQDASRLSSLIYGDVDGSSKLQEMLRFAQDLQTCRKVAFAKYFSHSSHLSTSAWDHPDPLNPDGGSSSGIAKCGTCDNCTRNVETVTVKDVTLDSWRILKVLQEVQHEGGRVTLGTLADLVRGLGGGNFAVALQDKKGKRKVGGEKSSVDLETVCGGKVGLNKEDAESILIHLLLEGYLDESYHATAYAVNVYLIASAKSLRLSRLSQEEAENGNITSRIECTFPKPPAHAKKSKGVDEDGEASKASRRKKKVGKEVGKAKKPRQTIIDVDGDDEDGDDHMEELCLSEPEDGDRWRTIPGRDDGVEEMDDPDLDLDEEEAWREQEDGWRVVKGPAGGLAKLQAEGRNVTRF